MSVRVIKTRLKTIIICLQQDVNKWIDIVKNNYKYILVDKYNIDTLTYLDIYSNNIIILPVQILLGTKYSSFFREYGCSFIDSLYSIRYESKSCNFDNLSQ